MTTLSEHFTEKEFIASNIAARAVINNDFIDPSHKKNAILLCDYYLEPIRSMLGKPITILSGYRCPEVNRLAKGSDTSAHMSGRAVDIAVKGMSSVSVWELIKKSSLMASIDQLILESVDGRFGNADDWVHLGIRVAQPPRGRAFKMIGGKVIA